MHGIYTKLASPLPSMVQRHAGEQGPPEDKTREPKRGGHDGRVGDVDGETLFRVAGVASDGDIETKRTQQSIL